MEPISLAPAALPTIGAEKWTCPVGQTKHRYDYDPGSGRLLQRDPIGIGGGFNVYAYVRGQATARIDPSGLDWIDVILEPIVKIIGPGNVLGGTGGDGHVPVLDPGPAQTVVLITSNVISIAAPIGAVGGTIGASAKTVRAMKCGRIGRRLQKIRRYIRYDPPHHGKPPGFDGKWFGGR